MSATDKIGQATAASRPTGPPSAPAASPPGTRAQAVGAPQRPIGSLDAVRDGTFLAGWAWDQAMPSRPARIAIIVDGDQAAVLAPQDFRADLVAAGIGHGCFAFSWRIPDVYRDGGPHEFRAFSLETKQELPGSPVRTVLARIDSDAAADFSAFVNPDFAFWPGGLQGRVEARSAEIAPALWVTSDEASGACRFMVAEPRPRADRTSGYYGVRIEFEQPGAWGLHHRIATAAATRLRFGATFSIELSLGEAEEPVAQRQTEIWLTRRTKDGFEAMRRLARGRVFRRSTMLTFQLQLTSEEETQAIARALFLSVTTGKSRVLRIYPSQLVRQQDAPREGLVGYEDTRLNDAFEACRRLARLNGRAATFERCLGEEPSGPPDSNAASSASVPPASPGIVGSTGNRVLSDTQYPFTQIVVPIFNGDTVIMDCLRSVQRATRTPFQVLAINDGSRAHTTALLRDLASSDPRFAVLDREHNRGYTKSINEAVKLTGADWIVILNSDTVVSDGWLSRLHDAAMSRPETGMVGPLSNAASWQSVPRVKDPDGSWSKNDFITPADVPAVQAMLERQSERAYPMVPLLNGFCTLISRKVFERCGLFDEDAFPIGYGEETDLCLRAGEQGLALVVADDCFVYHRKSVTFGTHGRKPLSRAGSLELVNKHPGVSIPQLEQAMQNEPVLARLRARLFNLRERL